MNVLLIGAVADDLTGACDLASFFVAAGLPTTVLLGVPDDDTDVDTPAVVVALKSRTIDAGLAAEQTFATATWLLSRGAELLYQKYCSTFDSTAAGNIGPAGDALLRAVRSAGEQAGSATWAVTVGTPASPAHARTQYQGHLFVGDRLLAETSMRDHPLTPMRDSDLVRLLQPQTRRRVTLIRHQTVRSGADAIGAEITRLAAGGAGHLLVDAVTEHDLEATADAILTTATQQPIVAAGAAGLGAALAARLAARLPARPAAESAIAESAAAKSAATESAATESAAAKSAIVEAEPNSDEARPGDERHGLVVCGSASKRTREQIAAFIGPRLLFDASELTADDSGVVERIVGEVGSALRDAPTVLVGVHGVPQGELDDAARVETGDRIERTLSLVAAEAIHRLQIDRLIVAGGETSGAVASGLGVRSLRVAGSAATGVPWMITRPAGQNHPLALVLKSGNFGEPDLFNTAWSTAP